MQAGGSQPSHEGKATADAEAARFVQILSCLVEALVRGIYAAIIVWALSYANYFYSKSQAGAWTLRLSGLSREATLTIAAASLSLLVLGLLGLALLSLIVSIWKRDLERTAAAAATGRSHPTG